MTAQFVPIDYSTVGPRANSGPAVSPAFYVSPTGNDANPGTFAQPFKTLGQAQSSMRASPTTKTTYLLGGTYSIAAMFQLIGSDAGTTWLGYPGQTPILDGGGTTATLFYIHASNVTVRWITFQNMVNTGIEVQIADGVTIADCEIRTNNASGFNQGGIFAVNTNRNLTITHNYIHDLKADGILVSTSTTDDISGLAITYNKVVTTCTAVQDCGAIHWNDRKQTSTGIVIDHNLINGYGISTDNKAGIYADDFGSGTITNNIVYGGGEQPYKAHGGSNLLVTNNIFDITSTALVGFYQGESSAPMTGNTFETNIVYSNGNIPSPSLWHSSTPGALPTVTGNLYYATTGTLPNVDPFVDTLPTVANPGFVNGPAHNYNFLPGFPPQLGPGPVGGSVMMTY